MPPRRPCYARGGRGGAKDGASLGSGGGRARRRGPPSSFRVGTTTTFRPHNRGWEGGWIMVCTNKNDALY